MKIPGYYKMPLSGYGNTKDHVRNYLVMAAVCLGGYFFVFIPVAYYVGLGTGMAEAGINALNSVAK